ncbi:hypothetical protein ACIA48_01185 [Mycobacterium sp. NPDC051804]|uniref:hypothetical protein n=1 Tax=Mycobacterium sp. NPDC051804 TaxID=3364295 RepID=UPI0037920A44
MSGEVPKFDPEALHSATAAFGDAAETLSRFQADEPVGDAASSVGDLLTAESCRKAQEGINMAVSAAVESVREYSESLDAASRGYSASEQATAADIAGVDIPN